MRVVIAEKPSVARDIAGVLKATTKRDGYLEGNGYAVTWALGHLVRLVEPGAYDPSFKRWDINTLPIVPDKFNLEIQPDPGTRKQFQIIKKLLDNSKMQEIICATDAGREGELIFRYIYEKAGSKLPIKRLWVSSQTDEALLEGFKNLKDGAHYDTLYDSARCRSEADWLIGINATRAYTTRYGRKSGVMSVGRVQTPVLKMIVDRYEEFNNFVPQIYYEIAAIIEHANGTFKGQLITDSDKRMTDKEKAEALSREIAAFPKGSIKEVSKKAKSEKPPLLYDLTELQKDANKRYKFSAENTLNLLQGLYERHKLVTYPRTSSRYLSNDLKARIPLLIKNASQLPQYKGYTDEITPAAMKGSSRVFDDKKVTDHHAVIPTEKSAAGVNLTGDEQKIYDLIIRRFLCAFMGECKKELTQIISLFGTYEFMTKGTVIKKPGWRGVYLEDKDEEGEDDQTLPPVKKADPVSQKETLLEEKKTKAPALYTEASILHAMETAGKNIEDEEMREAMKEGGLGTPATRAQILERLIQVQYITREKNKLIPTEKGISLISLIHSEELASPELTGLWEKKLNDIRKGDYKRDNFMNEIKEFAHQIIRNVKFRSSVQSVQRSAAEVREAVGKCPACGGAVVDRNKAYGCSNWKASGCSFVIWKSIAQNTLEIEHVKQLLETGSTQEIAGFTSRKGTKFSARLTLKDNKVTFLF